MTIVNVLSDFLYINDALPFIFFILLELLSTSGQMSSSDKKAWWEGLSSGGSEKVKLDSTNSQSTSTTRSESNNSQSSVTTNIYNSGGDTDGTSSDPTAGWKHSTKKSA